ncbi:MAG: saccharopine dehydrogenase NADP-binding domain-containing protein [Chitinophagaceae bacterium]|jgi:saccharopine dehydrogenase-like NADP-dependent oxidoreductase|nr:saccharopine dehydrogenase NADP-binding domain-containing protein [Chitinophagaceae bacterium]
MKRILVLGAGKSSTSLIEYLIRESGHQDWHVHVADMDPGLASRKAGGHSRASAHGISGVDDPQTSNLISQCDLVISMLPPPLHPKVAAQCLSAGKHFLNASYMVPDIQAMDSEAKQKGLVFLCEMGLDPGIDHMSAMALMDGIRREGGKIDSFRSHCGGLVAPESDNNPWHYKISWNPRNIVMAGKDGAHYRENGLDVHLPYEKLFDPERKVTVPGLGDLAWYPNRDSLSYLSTYGLEDIPTFVRTTLRHPDFCFGWKNIIDLKLTDESVSYDTDGMNLSSFFQIHFDRFGFSEWLQQTLSARFDNTKAYLEDLIHLMEQQQDVSHADEFLAVDRKGRLQESSIDREKNEAASGMAIQMHEANLALGQLFYLGLDSPEMINQGKRTAVEILQWVLERKLALQPGDKDMIVMLHEIGYHQEGRRNMIKSHLVVKGTDPVHTAMAKTVGLPLGIAASLALQGKIRPGVQIPVHRDIYELVLPALESEGIRFVHDHA